jgi:hypothetical protein
LVWLELVMLLMEVVALVLAEVFEVETKMVVGLMVLVAGMKVYFRRLAGMVEYFEAESEVCFQRRMIPH